MPNRTIIICDTEYYSDEGWNKRHNEDLPREIIQIGALKIDARTLAIIDSFDILVKPTVHKRLCPYIRDLTGINQQQMDAEGVALPVAFQRFHAFMDGGLFASYGDDWQMFMQTMRLNEMSVIELPDRLNLRGWFNQHAPETKDVNSGRLAEVMGVRPTCNEHSALADCYSIIDAMRHLVQQGKPNPFLP